MAHEKTLLRKEPFGFIRACLDRRAEQKGTKSQVGREALRKRGGMKRARMKIFYSGHVQGVGFRYTVKAVAAGFELTGTVRNLLDGRVELVAEGPTEELEAFRGAIRESGLDHFVRNEAVDWSEATGEFRGFEIVR